MVDKFKKFARFLTIFSVVILLTGLVIYFWVPKIPITPAFPYIVLFFYGFTLYIFRILNKAKENRLSRFTNVFMLINFSKLILFSIIILLYAYFNRSDAIPFTITFFINYIFYSAFEVVSLLKK
jgi:hypothetical protein